MFESRKRHQHPLRQHPFRVEKNGGNLLKIHFFLLAAFVAVHACPFPIGGIGKAFWNERIEMAQWWSDYLNRLKDERKILRRTFRQ